MGKKNGWLKYGSYGTSIVLVVAVFEGILTLLVLGGQIRSGIWMGSEQANTTLFFLGFVGMILVAFVPWYIYGRTVAKGWYRYEIERMSVGRKVVLWIVAVPGLILGSVFTVAALIIAAVMWIVGAAAGEAGKAEIADTERAAERAARTTQARLEAEDWARRHNLPA